MSDYYNDLLKKAIRASVKAGDVILEVYNSSDFQVENKEDNSPLTIADKKAHEIISEILSDTNIPILSEEGKDIPYEQRSQWKEFWLVDPLDGTKEFIKRTGEFTVNIALISDNESVMGVIYIPVLGSLYYSDRKSGTFYLKDVKKETTVAEGEDFDLKKLTETSVKLPFKQEKKSYTVVGSRSHMSKETEDHLADLRKQFPDLEIISKGSSLKLCMVAEGAANEYPRFGPTMEWDTAAGQAIVENAGGVVLNYETKQPLKYNKKNLLNPWFLVKNNGQF